MSFKYSGCYCTCNPEDPENDFVTDMEYLGHGKWKCPKCGDENDCHDIVFTMRLKFQKPSEKNNYCRIEVLEPYDERLDKKEQGATLKELIEDEFNENEFGDKHELGIFDVELLFHSYTISSDCGTDYDLDIDIVKEVAVNE